MATIKNIIQTIFTSQGAGDVNSDLDRVNKNVTRLGQSSSSAGRAFAAQSQGLGGLVAAYAGAAATVFALQQGFSALAKSARAMQTLEGLNSLAARTAQDGSALLESVREITKGQITLTESAQQINLALSAGFNTKQIEGLSEVALKASRALGRDLNDAYTRVVRGSAKMETELLDELGIYTKIAPATRAYAAAIGKNVTQLSEFERRQAFVNSVIEEGQRKFSSINTTIPTSAEQIEAFGVKIIDLATEIGKLIADTVAPLAAFLTNNVAGAFGAVGVAASLVASKALVTLTGAFSAATDSVLRKGVVLEAIIRKYSGTALAADTATNSIKALTTANIALQGAQKTQLTSLIDSANARRLTTPELVKSRDLITQNIAALNAERNAIRSTAGAQVATYRDTLKKVREANKKIEAARAMPVGGGFGTREFIDRTTAINRANIELRRATEEQNRLKPAIDATSASIRANTQALLQNRAALASVAPATQGFIAGLSGLAVGAARQASLFVSGFTGLFSAILSGASKLFFVSSIFTLIGSSIAGALGKGDEFEAFLKRIGAFFKGVFGNEDVKNAKNVIAGITSASFDELEKTNSELRDLDSFKFKSKIYGVTVEVEKSKQDLVNEVNSLLAGTFSSTEKSVAKSATSTATLVGSILGNIIPGLLALIPGFGIFAAAGARVVGTALGAAAGTIWDYFSDVPDIPPEVSAKIREQFSDSLVGLESDVQNKIVQALSSLELKYGDAAKFDPQARLALRTQQELILASKDYLENVEAVSQAMQATGTSAADVVKAFKFDSSSGSFAEIDKAITNLQTKISDTSFTGSIEFEFIPLNEDKLAAIYTDASEAVLSAAIAQSAEKQTALQDLIDYFGNGQQAINDFSENAISALTMLDEAAKDSGKTFAQYIQEDSPTVGSAIVEGLQKAGYTLEQLGQLAQKVNNDIKNSTLEAIGAVNEFSRSALRLAAVQKTLEERTYSGAISLEEFSQSLGASKDAQVETERYYSSVLRSIDDLREKTKNLSGDQLIAANNLIADLVRVAENTALNLGYQREITSELQKQQKVIETQITASDFFKSFELEKPKNPLALELELNLSGNLTPLDELTAKLVYLQTFIKDQGSEIVDQYNANREALTELALNDAERQKILATSAEDSAALVEQLNKLDGVVAYVNGSVLTVTTGIERVQGVITDGISADINLLEGAAGAVQQLTESAVQAQKDIILAAVQELPGFIDKAVEDYTKIIKDADAEIRKIASNEVSLKIKFDMDIASIDAQIAKVASDAIITRLQLDIDVLNAKKDLKKVDPAQAVREIAKIEQQIITEQQNQLLQQLIADQEALTAKSQLIEEEKKANQEIIRQEAQQQLLKLKNDRDYVQGLSSLYEGLLAKQNELNNNSAQSIIKAGNAVGDSWAKTFESGGESVATAIVNALTNKTVQGTTVVGGTAKDITTDSFNASLQSYVADFTTSVGLAEKAVVQLEGERIRASETAAAREQELIEKNRKLLADNYLAEYAALEGSREVKALNAEKELQDINKNSSEAAKKAEEARKKITEAYKDISDKLRESVREVAKEIVSFVGGILVSLAQSKVDNLKAQESQLQDSLSVSTERLNSVRNDLQQSLSEETTQRSQLTDITKELVSSQKEYIKSLGSQDSTLETNSDTYIQNLLKQKRAIIDLASSTRKVVALSSAEKKLAEINGSTQAQLNETTFERVDAERDLAATQGILQVVTDSVTASSQGLTQGLVNLRSAMLAMMQVTGMISGSGISMGDISTQANLSQALGSLSGAVETFREGVKSLKTVNGNYVNAAGQTVANVEKFNTTMNTFSSAIGGAVSGFNLGASIASALGKSGFASQIGGAIGGALGSVLAATALSGTGFGAAIAAPLAAAIGPMMASMVFSVGLPILGALLGSLFAKTPKGGASVGFDSSGDFDKIKTYASGGGSSKGLPELIRSTYTSFFGALESFGIELQKQGKDFSFSIDVVRSQITASFRKNGQKIKSQQVANGEAAAQFFIESFVKTFEKGDLLVQSFVAFSDTIQNAIDNFATKAQSARTYESLNEAIVFATKFNEALTELKGPAASTVDAIDLIREAAVANAAQASSFYRKFLDETRDVFGKSSKEYEQASKAVRKNALAQIGLVESTVNGTSAFISLTEAMESIDVGAVLVENAIASIDEWQKALEETKKFTKGEVTRAIAQARELALTDLVTDIQGSLQAGINQLENPASAGVLAIEAIVDNSASRISTMQGVYSAVLEKNASDAQKAIASSNVDLAKKLSKLEITAALENLSEAELKAVVAAEDKIEATIREEAANRLAAVSATKLAKAQVKLAEIGRSLVSELSDIPVLPGVVTSIANLMDLFETTAVTAFEQSLSSSINNIGKGVDIFENFTNATNLLNAELQNGTVSADAYIEGMSLVVDTTVEAIRTIQELIEEYNNVTEQIYSAYTAQVDAVATTAEEVGNQLTEMLDSFGSASMELLKIYDSTLASVAKSGNELFDLKDNAKSAFETAANAVREFEQANKLSGKSSSAILEDINSIQMQLNSMTDKPFDLSSLLEFSKLSSQQRALQSEYKRLSKVEQEYNDLLAKRSTAQEDLAFATATIDSLSSTLIDTRRTESEIVQKVQDAAIEYTKSQENLNDITKLLTESNFDLNQIRSSEVDEVRKTIDLLDQLSKTYAGLQLVTSEILSEESNLQDKILEAAKTNYSIRLSLASESEKASMASMEAFIEGVNEYYSKLEDASLQIQGMLENPINSLSESLKQGVSEVTAFNLAISDQFGNFAANLSSYIDLDNVSDNIKNFAESLDITQNRFAILASSNGPLSNLNSYLIETYNTLGLLTESGNFLDVAFERVETAFGSLFTAIGKDSEGLFKAIASLSINGADAVANLSTVTSYLKEFSTQIGLVKITLDGIDATKIPALINSIDIDVSPLSKISDLVQVVKLVDSEVGTLDLTNLNSFAGSIANLITGVNSTLAGLNLNLTSNITTDLTNFIYGLGEITQLSIALDLKEQVQATVQTYVYSIGNSELELSISGSLAESAVANISTYVNSLGDAKLTSDISVDLIDSAVLLINNYVKSLGDAELQTSIASNLRDSAVLAVKNYIESVGIASTEVNISSSLSDKAVQAIETYINSIGGSNTLFNITETTLSDSAISAVGTYIDSIGANTSTFNITGTTLSGNAVSAINTYVTSVGTNNTTFTVTGTTLINNAVSAVRAYVTSLGTNNTTFNITGTTLKDNAVSTIDAYVKSIGTNSSTFNIADNTLIGNAISAVRSYVESVGSNNTTFNVKSSTLLDNAVSAIEAYVQNLDPSQITFVVSNNTLKNNAIAAIRNYVSSVGTDKSTFTVDGTTLRGNAITAISSYVNSVGTNTTTFNITGATLRGNAISAVTSYVTGIGTNNTNFTISGTTLRDNAISAIRSYVDGVGTNNTTFSVLDTTLEDNAIKAIQTYIEGIDDNTISFNITSTTLKDAAVLAVDKYVKSVGASSSTFTVSGTTLSGNAVAAIQAYVSAVGTNTSAFSITGTTLRGNAVTAIRTYVTSVGTNNATFSITGTTLSGNAIAGITSYLNSIGSNNTKFSVTTKTLQDNAVTAVKTYVEGINKNTISFNITDTTLSEAAVSAIRTYVTSVGTNTTAFSITGTTLRDNAVSAIRTYVTGIGTDNTAFTISGTTLSGNAIASIRSYVSGVGTNNTTFTITGTTLNGNAVTAIRDYVTAIGTNNTTFTITDNTLKNNAINAIDTYLEGIDATKISFNIANTALSDKAVEGIRAYVSGVGTRTDTFTISSNVLRNNAVSAVSTYVGNIGTDTTAISIPYSKTTGLPSKIASWVKNISDGTDIDLTYNTKASGTLPFNVNSYITSLKSDIDSSIKGVADAFTPATTKVNDFVKALSGVTVDGKDIQNTVGLVEAIADLNSSTAISSLTSRFTSLKSALDPLLPSIDAAGKTISSPIDVLRSKLNQLKADIQTQWDNITLSATGTSAANPGFVRIVTTSGAKDPNVDTLNTIAENTKKYPRIKDVVYDTPANFATGGFVEGPGSSTSDSVPANLSNGEYVLRASAVRSIGRGMLEKLNSSGDLVSTLASQGRKGDTILAHINPAEAEMLRRAGGSGTVNPKTGILEFFNADPGVVGKVFRDKEIDLLTAMFANTNYSIPGDNTSVGLGRVNAGDNRNSSNIDSGSTKGYTQSWSEPMNLGRGWSNFGRSATSQGGPIQSLSDYANHSRMLKNSTDLVNYSGAARGLDKVSVQTSNVGSKGTRMISSPQTAWYRPSAYQETYYETVFGYKPVVVSYFPYKTENRLTSWQEKRTRWVYPPAESQSYTSYSTIPVDRTSENSLTAKLPDATMSFGASQLGKANIADRGTKILSGYSKLKSGKDSGSYTDKGIDKALVTKYVDAMNTGALGNFTDFYMLKNSLSKHLGAFPNSDPFAGALNAAIPVNRSSGGLMRGRDRIPAMLEPGEFVLRKQAVDMMGLDNAIRLNSTGNVNSGDIEVEVNINNNGTSQTAVGTPEVRRENGKIVVDIILEDLRNNGPINRQIRSIR